MLEKYNEWTKEFMDSWKELDWERTLNTLDKDGKCTYFKQWRFTR